MTLERLHIDHGDYLLTCLRLYGVPEQECEDVRQDLYLKMLEAETIIRDKFVKGFCSKIARNAAIDYLRKAGRMPTMESTIIIDEDGFSGDHPELDTMQVRAWDSVMDNSNTERIAQAMELSQQYLCQDEGPTAFEIIGDLLYGLTMEQISEKHEVSRHTVGRWLRDWQIWVNVKLPKGVV